MNRHKKNTALLEKGIADVILKIFGFNISVIVIDHKVLEKVVSENPFANKMTEDDVQPYVNFLSEIPTKENLIKLKEVDFKLDEFIVIGKLMYIWYGISAANTKLNTAVIERKLKLTCTARNFKTVKKLLELSNL